MYGPNIFAHILLIFSILLLIVAQIIVCVMFGNFSSLSWNEKIWMGSKIKTIEKIIKENNEIIYPILGIETNSNTNYSKNYKYLLEHSSNSECGENYKKCGILDSMGNIMCIPNEDQCPINDLIVESRYNHSNLLTSGFNISYPQALSSSNEAIYSSNEATDKGILSKLVYNNETQYYINAKNFVFDNDMYKDYQTSSIVSKWRNWHIPIIRIPISIRIPFFTVTEGVEGLRRLDEKAIYGDTNVTNYIKQKFKERNNIDKTFRNISNKVNAGYYLGFKDIDSLNKFSDKDFYNLYFVRYPNVASFVFSIILLVVFTLIIIFSLINLLCDECGFLKKLYIIFIYATFFIGFFVYFLVKYKDIYKKKGASELINIEADPFLEDFIREITYQIPKENLTLAVIILYGISLFIFILSFVLIKLFSEKNSGINELLMGYN